MAGLAHLACSARRPRRGAAALIGVAVVLVPMAADPAIAAPGRVTEFLLRTPNSGPSGITSGADRSDVVHRGLGQPDRSHHDEVTTPFAS